jgi:hypothetical protein
MSKELLLQNLSIINIGSIGVVPKLYSTNSIRIETSFHLFYSPYVLGKF